MSLRLADQLVYPETKGVLLEDMDTLFGDEPVEDDDDDEGDEDDDGDGSGSESSLPTIRKRSASNSRVGRKRAGSGFWERIGGIFGGGQRRRGSGRGEYEGVDGEQ